MPDGWRVARPDRGRFAAEHHGPDGAYLHPMWRVTPEETLADAVAAARDGIVSAA